MSLQESSSPRTIANFEPERALRLGAAASVAPLWAAFIAAAGAGVTYWWMTSWVRRSGESRSEPQSGTRVETKTETKSETRSYAPEAQPAKRIEVRTPRTAGPEIVMAHQPEPQPLPEAPVDESDDMLRAAPEELMEHRPVETEGAERRPALPAEILASDPVELAMEKSELAAEKSAVAAKPAARKAAPRKPQA